jgi:hypothetical protein
MPKKRGKRSSRPTRSTPAKRPVARGTPSPAPFRPLSEWNERIEELEAFRRQHGHCAIPSWEPEYANLGAWLRFIRAKKRIGRLDYRRVKRLEQLGVAWEPEQQRWEEMFAVLVQFRAAHGHCNVPRRYRSEPRLGGWVERQRLAHKRGKVRPDHAQRLEQIGFSWVRDDHDSAWEAKYAALAAFRREHGHCRVSTLCPVHASLGNWVRTQRGRRRRGELSAARVRRLNRLRFAWEVERGARRAAKKKKKKR